MSRLWLISNVYGNRNDENARMKKIFDWRFLERTEQEFEKLGFKKEEIQPPLINSRLDVYQLISPEGVRYPYSKMVAKGISIRDKFHRIIEKYSLGDEDRIIYLDGDGQIHFDHVFKMLVALKSKSFVVGKRNGETGISEERHLVEKFENSFIEDALDIELPDAQCGCWGFTGKHLKEIYPLLSAEGFEIELDLIICSTEKGVKPAFLDIAVTLPDAPTTFSVGEDDERKLAYLMKKFKVTPTLLIDKAQKFASKHKPLSTKYIGIFTSAIIKEIKF